MQFPYPPPAPRKNYLKWIAVPVVIVLVAVLAFLFWPKPAPPVSVFVPKVTASIIRVGMDPTLDIRTNTKVDVYLYSDGTFLDRRTLDAGKNTQLKLERYGTYYIRAENATGIVAEQNINFDGLKAVEIKEKRIPLAKSGNLSYIGDSLLVLKAVGNVTVAPASLELSFDIYSLRASLSGDKWLWPGDISNYRTSSPTKAEIPEGTWQGTLTIFDRWNNSLVSTDMLVTIE